MIDTAHTPSDKWSLTFVGEELAADDAHVWRVSLDQPADMIAKLAPLHSRDEYQIAERLNNQRCCAPDRQLESMIVEMVTTRGGVFMDGRRVSERSVPLIIFWREIDL
jgi:hypothetical protein